MDNILHKGQSLCSIDGLAVKISLRNAILLVTIPFILDVEIFFGFDSHSFKVIEFLITVLGSVRKSFPIKTAEEVIIHVVPGIGEVTVLTSQGKTVLVKTFILKLWTLFELDLAIETIFGDV